MKIKDKLYLKESLQNLNKINKTNETFKVGDTLLINFLISKNKKKNIIGTCVSIKRKRLGTNITIKSEKFNENIYLSFFFYAPTTLNIQILKNNLD